MNRYICIHGHFYQPPRENPWLSEVELQPSAHPYHDWNERVTAECYLPNASSRILDREGRIVDIVSNYERISFNFGPTLFRWLESRRPRVYRAVLEADRTSVGRFSGHGAALAQVYSHSIMPLASPRDKRTEVLWGIGDFKHRLGRDPEGMWLAETAVDTETLEALAADNIRFTILAPHQARRVRRSGEAAWQSLQPGTVDPTRAYMCRLPSGRSIALFFYNGDVARQVAFGDLLKNGERFAETLLASFSDRPSEPQMVHIAVDGETFGHHHRFGDMALAYALRHIKDRPDVRLTVYGEFLEKHPPLYEVEIEPDTSWSCAHGTGRWSSDCGCNTGAHPDFSQQWRDPLRQATSYLVEQLAEVFETCLSALFVDPWSARDDYVRVVLDRSPNNVSDFLERHAVRTLSDADRVTALKLCEMQRHALLMQASCGWFFDEISGLEPVQNMRSAARAMQLASQVASTDLETEYRRILEQARSNDLAFGNGKRVYEELVQPAVVDLQRVGAHHALASFFHEDPEAARTHGHTVEPVTREITEDGKMRLAVGTSRVRSEITREEQAIDFAFVHLGDIHISGAIRPSAGQTQFQHMRDVLNRTFQEGDAAALFREMEKHLGKRHYSFWHLFRDEKAEILASMMEQTLNRMTTSLREVLKDHHYLLRAIEEVGMTGPPTLTAGLHFILHAELGRLLRQSPVDLDRVRGAVEEARKWSVPLDQAALGHFATTRIDALVAALEETPLDTGRIKHARTLIGALLSAPLRLDLWEAQNVCFRIAQAHRNAAGIRARNGDSDARAWIDEFDALCALAGVCVRC